MKLEPGCYQTGCPNSAPKTICKDISKGDYDDRIIQSAERLKKYGEKHGGFFIRMFREANLAGYWPWAGDAKASIEAYRHVWEIYQDRGTNNFATWVWCPAIIQGSDTGSYYFPGEEYVDWIGLNGYNWGLEFPPPKSFKQLFGNAIRTYNDYGLPMMISETGCTKYYGKVAYIESVYQLIKNKYKNIRGVSYWNLNYSNSKGHHNIANLDNPPEAWDAVKRAVQDPYFLKRIDYRSGVKK